MGATEFLKAVSKLQAFRSNLPNADIDEELVIDYHDILRALESETGEQLFQDFDIPEARMERQIFSSTIEASMPISLYTCGIVGLDHVYRIGFFRKLNR